MASSSVNFASLKNHSFGKVEPFKRERCWGYNGHKVMPNTRCTTMGVVVAQAQGSSQVEDRRSANYKPTTWTSDFVESLRRDHALEMEHEKVERLAPKVRTMVGDESLEPSKLLRLIDDIQRLSLANHFNDDIETALNRLASNVDVLKSDLHDTALIFRLLRQNGIPISQDILKQFKDESGNFKSSLVSDIQGMLSLYEASYLAFEGEQLLDEAQAFTRKHLIELSSSTEDKLLADYVNYTLETPLQHRMPRLEARRLIETYPRRNLGMNEKDLLELAKRDFNMAQSMYQKELQEMSMWWKGTALADKLSFARDRLVECFLWGSGTAPNPQFSACRRVVTKVFKVVVILDDIYDVHGYMDELEAFTRAVERWDVAAMDELPDYMKLTFLALYNTVNEMGYEILKDRGLNCIPYLKKAWEDLCKAFLVEAKWYYGGETPTFKEYLDNASISVSGPVMLTHAYFFVSPEYSSDALESLLKNHELLRYCSVIFRLANDLVTSEAELQRGESANAISCYAKEAGVSFDEAREHINKLIDENWKGLNRIRVENNTPFSVDFIEATINLARTCQFAYKFGDGLGSPELIKEKLEALFVEPVQ